MGNFKFNFFSCGISLRAEVSISSSYLYSKCYHAMRFFGNFIFAFIARMFSGNRLNMNTKTCQIRILVTCLHNETIKQNDQFPR